MKLLIRSLGLLTLALALSSCGTGRKSPPKVAVVAVNVAPSYDQLAFFRVEKNEGTLPYRSGAPLSFDADTYRFHFDTTTPDGSSMVKLYELTKTLDPSSSYTFLLHEVNGALQADVLDFPVAIPPNNAEILVGHTAAGLGPVDVYVEPDGTDLTTVAPFAQLAYGDISAAREIPIGVSQITLTEQGNPANVILTTGGVSFAAGSSGAFFIAEGANVGLDDYSIVAASAVSGSVMNLVDKNLGSSIRVINTISDRNPIDVVMDGASTPLFTSVPYGTVSDYQPVAAGDHTLTVHPSSDPNSTWIDAYAFTLDAGGRFTVLIGGDPAGASSYESLDDLRSVPDRARVHYFDGSAVFLNVDFFLVPRGTDIANATPVQVFPESLEQNYSYAAGDYDLWLRENSTTNILAGPVPVTIAAGGVYGVVATDSTTSGALDVVLFDDFN